MKRKFLSILLIMITVISTAVYAGGLDNYTDVNTYEKGIFADVSENDWFANGVRTVYKKGIMNGTGEKSFSPDGKVTWAQAVTIASRLSAVYNQTEIPAAEGEWYQSYLDYAESINILPSTCPKDTTIESANISRQELAGLFANVFAKEDLVEINSKSIPDENEIDDEFKTAVAGMYAAGIITGKDGGKFDPSGLTTRAEIATIVSRLLFPAQRVGYDEKTSAFMNEQAGNFYNGALTATKGDITYYLMHETSTEGVKTFSILSRSDSGEIKQVYTSENTIKHLSVLNDKEIMFCDGNVLYTLNTDTTKAKAIYSGNEIETYGLYDGKIYVAEEYTGATLMDERRYRIRQIEGSGGKTIIDGVNWKESMHWGKGMHFFRNKLYIALIKPSFYDGKETGISYLYEIDLETKKKKELFEISMKNIVFIGSTAYYMVYNGNAPELMRINLAMPEYPEKIADMPEEFGVSYQLFYANGSNMYFQSSGAQSLWRVYPTGKTEKIATADTSNVEYSTVNSQGIFMHALSDFAHLIPAQIDAIYPDGSIGNYCEFLGKPYCVEGQKEFDIIEETKVDNYQPWEKDGFVEKPLAKYFNTNGDLVIELEISNNSEDKITLNGINMFVKCGEKELSTRLIVLKEIVKDSPKVFTLVIPKETIGEGADKEKIGFKFQYSVNRKKAE